jgi:hypothetical protein
MGGHSASGVESWVLSVLGLELGVAEVDEFRGFRLFIIVIGSGYGSREQAQGEGDQRGHPQKALATRRVPLGSGGVGVGSVGGHFCWRRRITVGGQ